MKPRTERSCSFFLWGVGLVWDLQNLLGLVFEDGQDELVYAEWRERVATGSANDLWERDCSGLCSAMM